PALVDHSIIERLLVVNEAARPGVELLKRRMRQCPIGLPSFSVEETVPPRTASASSAEISRSPSSTSGASSTRSRPGISELLDIIGLLHSYRTKRGRRSK